MNIYIIFIVDCLAKLKCIFFVILNTHILIIQISVILCLDIIFKYHLTILANIDLAL